ncbi:MAG: hypothetical protein MGG37_17765, partial [Trichodesmium sp. MAG_R01]|nr:hypothetical protein [Trichodesmium sp. MAG_R01]
WPFGIYKALSPSSPPRYCAVFWGRFFQQSSNCLHHLSKQGGIAVGVVSFIEERSLQRKIIDLQGIKSNLAS